MAHSAPARILRTLSLLLLGLGMFCGYWWFYKLAPARRTLDPEWHASHSQREYWREVQKGIHRGMWLHDDGFAVGMYGDKAWAEWIMAHVKPGEAWDVSVANRVTRPPPCGTSQTRTLATTPTLG